MLDQEPGKEKWDFCPLPFVKLKKCLEKWQKELHGCGWNSLFWDNHDLPRIVSRWGNDREYRVEAAKMLATVLHGMEGTPYVYQGEELGMTNVRFDSIEQYQDIEIRNMYRERLEKGYAEKDIMESIYAKGRDNARTPMQWDDTENAGFTTGTPWLGVNPNYTEINARSQLQDENSVFHYYKKLIHLRKENSIFVDGDFTLLLPEDENIFAYVREYEGRKLLVAANFTDKEVECPLLKEWGVPADEDGAAKSRDNGVKLLIHNYNDLPSQQKLRPYEAMIWEKAETGTEI